ncbi:glycerophosphodiester phosphodiesterase family protein [Paraburkholderia rhizosphaerae]|uniref:glycerophosphodiester phosphodiesterase family protein n=1 Tax=Paraburkholderia rhizosphaerae TaxID=480658 RepID=UPI0035E6BC29
MFRTICAASALSAVLLVSACGAGSAAQPSDAMAASTLPRIVAHRAGTADAPENTLEAIHAAIANRADAIWLTVQLSADGVPVLYRPADLSALTDASGPVASRTAAELARINAGWTFKVGDAYPYRAAPVPVPTLRDALRAIPAGMPVILDMKALPAGPQTLAVARVLTDEDAWSRVTLYSTDDAYQRSFAVYPQARLFESRDATRTRLVHTLLAGSCGDAPAAHTWTAFEMHRALTVTEKFTLGEGRSEVSATLWTPATVACFRQQPDVRIVAIAVNNADDYRAAACLGIDAVLSDSPRQMSAIRAALGAALVTTSRGAQSKAIDCGDVKAEHG